MSGRVFLALGALIATALAGCAGGVDDYYKFDAEEQYQNPGVFPGRYNIPSLVLEAGDLKPADPVVTYLRSDRPAYHSSAKGINEATAFIPVAVWLPMNVSEPVPVIVDAGPYFEQGQHCPEPKLPPDRCPDPLEDDTIDWPGQMTPFALENFLPHGYAVVQVAVRGTGTAGGCMDLMGQDERDDLSQAITWLANQEWSNGNVAMWGVSYDGSTPWEVAATGNPALKTIIPISGLPSMYDLMFRNGSAESRGPLMHSLAVYYGYGFDDDFPHPLVGFIGGANGRQTYQDLQNAVCPDAFEGHAMGAFSTAAADRGGEFSDYWNERDHRQDVLDNYEGSVFMVHGLQDWNVDPHVVHPFMQQLKDAGIKTKEWYGQWGHARPDGCYQNVAKWATTACRLDWAEVALRWFDSELKGKDVDTGPPIQVQDDVGFWRNAETWPATKDWLEFYPTEEGGLSTEKGTDWSARLLPPGATGPGNFIEFVTEPLEEELRFSGAPQFKIPFVAESEGGYLGAWLFDVDHRNWVRAKTFACDEFDTGDCVPCDMNTPNPPYRCDGWQLLPIVGHGHMNIRYHGGGEERQTMVPGQRYVAQFEFEPLEVVVPAGNRLGVWLFQYHYYDRFQSFTPGTINVQFDDEAKLRFPTFDLDPRSVFPVPGALFQNTTYIPQMYTDKPYFWSPADDRVAPTERPATCTACNLV